MKRDPPNGRIRVDAVIATMEGRYDQALGIFRRLRDRQHASQQCELFAIGETFDRAGQPDSAIVYFEQLKGHPPDGGCALSATRDPAPVGPAV